MIKYILILLLSNCKYQQSCDYTISEINKAFLVLYEKGILVANNNILNINISRNMDFSMPNDYNLIYNNQTIKIKNQTNSKPDLIFRHISQSMEVDGRVFIHFTSYITPREFTGTITFDCVDNNYKFIDINYFSSIE